jgi:hypothetical protein
MQRLPPFARRHSWRKLRFGDRARLAVFSSAILRGQRDVDCGSYPFRSK